jgi:hypothetical protein
MKRSLFASLLMVACWFAIPAGPALAQYGGGGGGGGGGRGGGGPSADDDAAKAKKDEEWSTGNQNLNLPGAHNAGPCPYVKVLYDAARTVDFKNDQVAADAVGYTGEFQGLSAGCVYKGVDPIHVAIDLLFAFGRGPQAEGSQHDYAYWVAVTDRDKDVIAKEYFTVRAVFPNGADRVLVRDSIGSIVIPRANANVSGSNFEILLGFDVTPQMADFNGQGKRFRADAGAPATTAQAGSTGNR